MKRLLVLLISMTLLLSGPAAAAAARPNTLTPSPNGEGLWVTGPNPGSGVEGSSGTAKVGKNGTTFTLNATGLVPGQVVTVWIAYYNDGTLCEYPQAGISRCGVFDLIAKGGIANGAGHVIGSSGTATFSVRLNVGDGPDIPIPGTVAYEPSDSPDYVVIVRSHGPKIPGQVSDQIHTTSGGCLTEVGPPPGGTGGEIPDAEGECGDLQLYVFETPSPNYRRVSVVAVARRERSSHISAVPGWSVAMAVHRSLSVS